MHLTFEGPVLLAKTQLYQGVGPVCSVFAVHSLRNKLKDPKLLAGPLSSRERV